MIYSKPFRDKLILNTVKNLGPKDIIEDQIFINLKKLKLDDFAIKRLFRYHFPRGADDLIIKFNELINTKLHQKFKKKLNTMRISEKILLLIIERFKILNSYKIGTIVIFKYLLDNKKILLSNRILYNVADNIWYTSDDKSLDFNFYSKRFILMKIYFLSFNVWKVDNSKSIEKTIDFTKKQILNVNKFGTFKRKIKNFFN